jgi:hypothetical protein
MKALSLIAIVFAAFLIYLGISSRVSSGRILGNAVVTGGVIIAAVVAAVWIIMFVKEKKENKSAERRDPDSR